MNTFSQWPQAYRLPQVQIAYAKTLGWHYISYNEGLTEKVEQVLRNAKPTDKNVLLVLAQNLAPDSERDDESGPQASCEILKLAHPTDPEIIAKMQKYNCH